MKILKRTLIIAAAVSIGGFITLVALASQATDAILAEAFY